MSDIQIVKVESQSQLKTFIRLPWKIYRNDSNWVPPLIMDIKNLLNRQKNPFFQHSSADYFLAYKNGQPAGRIAAILNNNHNEFHGEKTGFFGFFESIDDLEVAKALFSKAEEWVKSKGQERLRGPMNFTTNDTCGMLLEGFDLPPMIMMTYNPSYYNGLLQSLDYEKAEDLLAYKMLTAQRMGDRISKLADLVRQKEGITVRQINMKNFWQEVKFVHRIYNDAWSKNWGFVPMTDAEFHHLAKELKPVVDPRYALIAELDGEPIGFGLSLPDFNQALIKINGRLFPFGLPKLLYHARKIDQIRVIILGVIKKHQHTRGLGSLLYQETYDRGVKHGLTGGEFSWILESNKAMNSAARIMGAHVYKRYRVYEKSLL